jgi:hypothetical protein
VGVEKGTKGVISLNFSLCGGQTLNNLRADFSLTNDQEEFFNTHSRLRSLTRWSERGLSTINSPLPTADWQNSEP